MSYSEFLIVTPREFLVILEASNRFAFEKYKHEMEEKRFWHVANMNFQLPTDKQCVDPKQWLKFEWETIDVKVLSDVEIESRIELMCTAWSIN